jgi:hypothetical protein
MTKRGFVRTAACGLASALVGKDAVDVVAVGSRITVNRLLDLGVTAQIACGEGGVVDYVEPETNTVWILLDKMHYGLADWQNHIWLVPFDTDDIIGGITFIASGIAFCASHLWSSELVARVFEAAVCIA